ncbi:nitrogen fixation protein NifZ [Blastochloris sulfoviridis]|uniref:Nitrogen fixation protein NifZ n=1 Tax=Blastochloris sulfoviridis TaxID=50712 RepID=A0A5M6I2M3_9HYPH|nr:nitrogen fixation protein NifZ [Blastochloris sulfoviridis]KAA5602048.1 nitrogen fixation protein NifZ [Blastochloris sulfoviridis]
MITDEAIEVYDPPAFKPGEKVCATKYVKNDGTYPLKDIGEILVKKGDVGYVRDIGTYLQRFYVYAVEFVDRGTIVGMRGRELVSLDKAATETATEERNP